MVDKQILPKLVNRFGLVILLFEHFNHMFREGSIEINMPKHVPSVGAAYGDVNDTVMRTRLHTPLAR